LENSNNSDGVVFNGTMCWECAGGSGNSGSGNIRLQVQLLTAMQTTWVLFFGSTGDCNSTLVQDSTSCPSLQVLFQVVKLFAQIQYDITSSTASSQSQLINGKALQLV
jgi:hypothetical protein